MADIPLLRKAVEWVEEQDALPAEESRWVQGYWRLTVEDARRVLANTGCSCGSCERAVVIARRIVAQSCGTCYCVAGWVCDQAGLEWLPHGFDSLLADGRSVSTAAAQALGIDPEDAHDLFLADNTAAAIRRHAERIAGEPL